MSAYMQLQRCAHGLLWLTAAAPIKVLAAAEREGAPPSLFDGAYLLQVFGSLLLVFGCIFGLVMLLKKINGMPITSGNPIRILASAKVGSREKIILLDAGEKQLLIGVAAGSVRTLHVYEQTLEQGGAGHGKSADFASLLRSSSQGRDKP